MQRDFEMRISLAGDASASVRLRMAACAKAGQNVVGEARLDTHDKTEESGLYPIVLQGSA